MASSLRERTIKRKPVTALAQEQLGNRSASGPPARARELERPRAPAARCCHTPAGRRLRAREKNKPAPGAEPVCGRSPDVHQRPTVAKHQQPTHTPTPPRARKNRPPTTEGAVLSDDAPVDCMSASEPSCGGLRHDAARPRDAWPERDA
jgi:hypothetical protein